MNADKKQNGYPRLSAFIGGQRLFFGWAVVRAERKGVIRWQNRGTP
jgi:flagellar biosynthesis regulator FlbT